MSQQHVVFGVPGFQQVPVGPDRGFVAYRDNLASRVLVDFFLGELADTLGDVPVAFPPAGRPQVAYEFPVAVAPQGPFAVPDARAAEFVARLDDALVGDRLEWLFAVRGACGSVRRG